MVIKYHVCGLISEVKIFVQTLALTVVGIGAVFSLIFHVGTKEQRLHRVPSVISVQEEHSEPSLYGSTSEVSDIDTKVQQPVGGSMLWKCWLKEPQFYQVGLLQESCEQG